MGGADAETRSSEVQPPALVQTGRRRILLAEDNVINQRLVLRLLEKQGFSARVANNGLEALAAVQEESFDLALMDVQMPDMSGLEATAAIRALEQPSGRHLPVVAMTAHAMKGDRERCLHAGMDGYLSKPIQVKELLSIMNDLLPAVVYRPGAEEFTEASQLQHQTQEKNRRGKGNGDLAETPSPHENQADRRLEM